MSVEISDHALVRYIERVKGGSLENFREEIRALIAEHKDLPHPGNVYHEGFTFVLEDHGEREVVVTVLPPGFRKKEKRWTMRAMVHVPNTAVDQIT